VRAAGARRFLFFALAVCFTGQALPLPESATWRSDQCLTCKVAKFIAAVCGGWPKIISNLRSLLETVSAVL